MLQSVLRHHSLSGLCSGSDGLRSISAIGCDFSGRDGIGICSVEEIGSLVETPQASGESKKLPSQPANGNYGGPKVRDRLCQIIRQHQLDPNLVKSYATDFCGVKALREAKREQVEAFVVHLADWAQKDRNALLCQLNSYFTAKEGAA